MKEIKILNKIENDCEFNDDIGYYKTINDGLDDIVILKNYTYKQIIKKTKQVGLGVVDCVEICNVSSYETYIVQPLDTIEKIAAKLNVDSEQIRIVNNLKNDRLFIGQELKI